MAPLLMSPPGDWAQIVLGAVTFVATLAGAAVAVLIGIPLLRGSGNPVYPATALTVVRIIARTAALTAVFAVFALAVGAILRQGAGAVTAAITAVILPYLLTAAIPVLPAGAAEWVLRVAAPAHPVDGVRPRRHRARLFRGSAHVRRKVCKLALNFPRYRPMTSLDKAAASEGSGQPC